MITIDGKPISEYDAKHPARVKIDEAIAEIKKSKNWTIKFHPRLVKKRKSGEAGSYEETSQGVAFKAVQKYSANGMEYDVGYFPKSPMRDGKLHNDGKPIDFSTRLVFDSSKEADKIFAYVCLSPYCGRYAAIEKYQNLGKKEPVYIVEDIAAEAKALSQIEEMLSNVRSIIFGNNIKEEKLRNVAEVFGVRGAKSGMDINLVKLRLKDILLKTENGKYNLENINDFMNAVKGKDDLRLRAAVENAIEHGIIGVKTGKVKSTWFTLTEDKQESVKICDVPKIGDTKEALIEYLSEESEKLRNEFIAFAEAGQPAVVNK